MDFQPIWWLYADQSTCDSQQERATLLPKQQMHGSKAIMPFA